MPEETIKERIDQDKNNRIDINEINKFIFNEKEGEKNLTDLGNYLNKLDLSIYDEIKIAINNYFSSTERIDNYNKKIHEKVTNNNPLDKKELSLMYLKMTSDGTWPPLPVVSYNFTFDSNEPIDKICNGALINYIRSEYKNWKYLSTNSSNDSDEKKLNTGSLKERTSSSTTRPATQKEISLIPKTIKNLLSSLGEKFVKGKDILGELLVKGKDIFIKTATGTIEIIGEIVEGVVRIFIDFAKIKSSPSEKNPKTGVTQCSKTAQKNANFFGINIPGGNAKEGVHKPIIDKEHFVSTKTKLGNNNSYIDINVAAPDTANLADISVESDTINGRKYGHRAIAFKNNDGQRYVLDPYYSGGYNTKPIPWEKYPKHSRAEKINFYNAPKQSRSTT